MKKTNVPYTTLQLMNPLTVQGNLSQLKRNYIAFQSEVLPLGKIEIKTLLKKDQFNDITEINALGPQEDFVSYTKPKLSGAPINTKTLQDLEKLLDDNKEAFAEDERQIGITHLIKYPLIQVIINQ